MHISHDEFKEYNYTQASFEMRVMLLWYDMKLHTRHSRCCRAQMFHTSPKMFWNFVNNKMYAWQTTLYLFCEFGVRTATDAFCSVSYVTYFTKSICAYIKPQQAKTVTLK